MLKKLSTMMAALALAFSASAADLFVNGKVTAEIVIPQKALSIEQEAAADLAEMLEKATGAKFEIVTAATQGMTPIRLGRAAKVAPPAKMDHGVVVIGSNAIDIVGYDGNGEFKNLRTPAGTFFATCEFLERELGVRYLWPGEIGTYVEKKASLTIAPKQYDVIPHLPFCEWRLSQADDSCWNDIANKKRYYNETFRWLRRQRNSFSAGYGGYGHAFGNYYAKYFKTNPNIFQLNFDGTRGPRGGAPIFSSMCVTNPEFWKIIIDNWNGGPILNLNENDTAGQCVCPECLKWDLSKDEGRVERAKKAFEARNRYWYKELGSLSNRYAHFLLETQKLADKKNPNHTIIGLIYANYYEPPTVKLNKRILMRYCPPLMFPWSDRTVKMAKDTWQGWYDAGVSLMFRPNCTLDGHNFPLLYYPEFADLSDFMSQRGIAACDLDSLTGSFSTNALTLYVIASKMAKGPRAELKNLEDDYFKAFGLAEPALRKFIAIMRKATLNGQDILERERDEANIVGSSYYTNFFTVGVKFYTPDVLDEGEAALKEAEAAVAADKGSMAARRVEFLRLGYDDMKMVLKCQREFNDYHKSHQSLKLAKAMRDLYDYRKANESKLYCNIGFFRKREENSWPTPLMFFLDGKALPIELGWEIKFSPDKNSDVPYVSIGVDNHWERQEAGLAWEKANGHEYKGKAWYRVKFNVTAEQLEKVLSMEFGAVDGTGEYFLNGKKFWYRPYPFKGDTDSWRKPFSVPGKELPLKVGENFMEISVEKHIGRSGIWRPVYLKLK
ncbi:MAG: DUF4838 domain-containing protein [Victivallales bacterium]|nr:DUF4838 domain-containing protein [Victivallales bacterium]